MALSTPEQVQLFGKSDAPAGSSGFKLTGEAKEGDGLCRIWLRPNEAWDRALNPRMESDQWDARAYRKLDSAFEFVPEFTLKDLEQMAENFDFPQDSEVFDAMEFNGDPVHDIVLEWARHVTGSSNSEPSKGFTVREPQGRYATASGTESLDYNRDLVFSSSSPAPLGGIAHRRPAPIPASAKKAAPPATATEKRVDSEPKSSPKASGATDEPRIAPAGSTPPPPQPASDESEARVAPPGATPPAPQSEQAEEEPRIAPPGATPPAPAPEKSVAEAGNTSSQDGPPPPPAPAKKKAAVAKTTQAMSLLSDDDFEEDKLSALRARLAKGRATKDED